MDSVGVGTMILLLIRSGYHFRVEVWMRVEIRITIRIRLGLGFRGRRVGFKQK